MEIGRVNWLALIAGQIGQGFLIGWLRRLKKLSKFLFSSFPILDQ